MAGVDDDLVVDPCQPRVRLDLRHRSAEAARSDPEDLRLGGCELLIGEHALPVKLRQLLELARSSRPPAAAGGGGACCVLRRCCCCCCCASCWSYFAAWRRWTRPDTAVAVPATTAVRAAMRRSPMSLPLDSRRGRVSLPRTLPRRQPGFGSSRSARRPRLAEPRRPSPTQTFSNAMRSAELFAGRSSPTSSASSGPSAPGCVTSIAMKRGAVLADVGGLEGRDRRPRPSSRTADRVSGSCRCP